MHPQPPEPPLVTIEPAVEQELDSYYEFTGYLKAVETQEIRAQVTGYIKKINFKDGDTVKEGDELFEIDPEPYEAALQNAEAGLAKAKADIATSEALLARTSAEYDRGIKLQSTKSLSAEDFDARKAAKDTAAADLLSKRALLLSAEATLRNAQFDRSNCTIRSKVKGAGRISRTLLTKGNLVTSGQTLLCKITSLDPIYAFWDVDEMTTLKYRASVSAKTLAEPSANPPKCWIALKNEKDYPHIGKIDYVAPEIERGTGMLEIRAVLKNDEYRLSPGDSIRVQVEAGAPQKYITVPEVAVGTQQRQKFVYVVVDDKGKQTVEFRKITAGPVRQSGNIRLQIVEEGLKPGEKVIVNGLLRVRPGVEVKTKEQAPELLPKRQG
jgi:RND family efflux transporter MFP subunit